MAKMTQQHKVLAYILNTENVKTLNLITSSAGLAVAETLEEICNIKTLIKWPNDIYYKDKKLCGILIEHSIMGAGINHSILGVGINVNQHGGNSTSKVLYP